MSEHRAKRVCECSGVGFTVNKHSRAHRREFDGGAVVPASAAPDVVRPPLSDPAAVDPEEAFVAALSSRHMLWLLSLAAQLGFAVDRYEDDAVGVLGTDAEKRLAITRVARRPKVEFGGARKPMASELESLHRGAHASCFLANSVKSEIIVRRA
ncbi:MAG: OsmC family protein [Planctomycetota bacterium]